ncbi:MAG: dihydroxy-acid dehydratase [Pseudomonadales bacterium]|nr:dihydroxy-acid dehydratase [Pseudomonadales bacterium]
MNAAIHLIVLRPSRAGTSFTLEDFDAIGRCRYWPTCTTVRQVHHAGIADAGGLPAMLTRTAERLDPDCMTVTGKNPWEKTPGARVENDDVIRSLTTRLPKSGCTGRGNLAPQRLRVVCPGGWTLPCKGIGRSGGVRKRGRPAARIHDPTWSRTHQALRAAMRGPKADLVWLKRYDPHSEKLTEEGTRDMVRISDARR